MDPTVVKLVTERLNLSAEESRALERGDVSSIVASRFAGDPAMMALVSSMAQRENGARRGEEAEGEEDDDLRRQRRIIRRLERDLEAADEILLFIARMLGACPSCFGGS